MNGTHKMNDRILTSLKNNTLTIAINSPKTKNSFDIEMYKTVTQLVKDASNNKEISSIIFTGIGDFFCSGNNVSEFVTMSKNTLEDNLAFKKTIKEFMLTIIDCPKVLIAAVNGPAIGVGTTLLLHCDYVISHPNAYFQTPFVNLGLIPEFASSLLLPKAIGDNLSKKMLLLGQRILAKDLYPNGFVSELSEDSSSAAESISKQVSKIPPIALSKTKSLLSGANKNKIYDTVNIELDIFFEFLSSYEAQESVNAFIEKREPKYIK